MLVEVVNRATWPQRKTPRRGVAWSPLMASHTVSLNFLKQSGRWPAQRLRRKLSQLPPEQRVLPPTPRDDALALPGPQAAKGAWEHEVALAEMKIRKALGVATKEYGRACVTNRVKVRERIRRLGKTGRVFRGLLCVRRANGKEILTIGEGSEKQFLSIA